MLKNKKILAVLLAFCMLVLSLSVAVSAEEATEPEGSNYPYIFVHGMMGWGSYDGAEKLSPYWGGRNGDMLQSLREQGYECYSASVGKISSYWDRACELYAQLTGTVVDYGEAHSAAHNHARYGRSYEGNALMDTFGKTDENGDIIKVNLFGHSMGGPTVRLLAWLLENGSEAEREASGEEVSSLFVGGKGHYVHSVTTWSAPHNGSPVANVLYDNTKATVVILGLLANILGSSSRPDLWDYQLEQYGLTSVKSQGIKARFSLTNIKKFISEDDNCGYDLTLRGSKALNDMIDTVDGIYYFSVTGQRVHELSDGTYAPNKGMFIMFPLSARLMGKYDGSKTYDGIVMDKSWALNDGVVPVISGRAPFDEEAVEYEEVKDSPLETGIWHVMPIIENFSHVGYMGMDTSEFQYLYERQMQIINSLE